MHASQPQTPWSRLAQRYDLQLPLERPALAAAVDLGQPGPDDTLLDLGTGTGGLLRELARRRDRPRLAVGVDESAAMLEHAGALPQGWSLETGDARRLRFPDGAFSLVTAAYLLHVVDPESRRQIVAEARRVLRPGGNLVVVTPTWPRTRVARMLYAPLASLAGSATGPLSAFRPLDPRAALESASFRVQAARHIRRGYPSLCVAALRSGDTVSRCVPDDHGMRQPSSEARPGS